MAASASSMPTCSPESWQPPGPAILESDSWACWPRIKRQRVTLVLSTGIGSQVFEVEAGKFVELLLFLFSEFSAQDFADFVNVCAPDFAKVFGDAALFLRAEIAECATKEDECAFEFVVG